MPSADKPAPAPAPTPTPAPAGAPNAAASVNPLSIIFVKSDSKGDRLLFRYPDPAPAGEGFSYTRRPPRHKPYAVAGGEELLQTPLPHASNILQGNLSGFTDEVLSTLFAVKAELCNRKFELKVNDVRFVGHPTLLPYRSNKDDTSATMILINIVFALQASASHSIVKCYYDLSERLGKALRHEEERCSYLSEEMKIMIAAADEMSALDSESTSGENEEEDENLRYSVSSVTRSLHADLPPTTLLQLILQRSSLARSLRTVFEDLGNTGLVQVRINRWVLVSFCLPHKAHQIHNTRLVIEPETIDNCLKRLKAYHGMLLMVDPNELLECMPLDGSAALLRLIKLYSPLKSLQTIALEADLHLQQVFQLVGHLVYWAKATIIYPLCESNVYVVANGADVSITSPLVDSFRKQFPGLCLLQVLAEFSLPAPLWYHARCGPAGGGADGARLARIVAWLLRRRLLLQLHTYVQFSMSHWGLEGGKEYYCEKHSNYNQSLSESISSLHHLQITNIPEPIDPRTPTNHHYRDEDYHYPTENHLNQTDFSHTKPIVIESILNRINGMNGDSANHSLDDGIDTVDYPYLSIVKSDDQNNATSVDSGIHLNGHKGKKESQNKLGNHKESGNDNELPKKILSNSPDEKDSELREIKSSKSLDKKSNELMRVISNSLDMKDNELPKIVSSNSMDTKDLDKSPMKTSNSLDKEENELTVLIRNSLDKKDDESLKKISTSLDKKENDLPNKISNAQDKKEDELAKKISSCSMDYKDNEPSKMLLTNSLDNTNTELPNLISNNLIDKTVTKISKEGYSNSLEKKNDEFPKMASSISLEKKDNDISKHISDSLDKTDNELHKKTSSNSLEKKLSGQSIDRNSLDSEKSSKEDEREMEDRGRQKSNSSLFSTASDKTGISLNLKIQSEMSFQPPTVIWSALGCDVVDACGKPAAAPSGQPDQLSEEMMLASFTEEEKAAIFRIPAAHNPDDLALLAQLHKKGYFRGEMHLEEIMFTENLTRSQVLMLIDKFRDVLITYETEDPAIAMLYSY